MINIPDVFAFLKVQNPTSGFCGITPEIVIRLYKKARHFLKFSLLLPFFRYFGLISILPLPSNGILIKL